MRYMLVLCYDLLKIFSFSLEGIKITSFMWLIWKGIATLDWYEKYQFIRVKVLEINQLKNLRF